MAPLFTRMTKSATGSSSAFIAGNFQCSFGNFQTKLIYSTKLRLNLIQYQKASKDFFMQLSETIKPISFLKSKTADVINSVNENRQPIIITQNGEAKAVIQDIKSYESLRNSISLLKLIIQGEEDIQNGNVIPQDEMFDNLEKKLFDSNSK